MSAKANLPIRLYYRCGVLDIEERHATIYDTDRKYRSRNIKIPQDDDPAAEELQYVGVLTSVSDCVVTTNETVSEINKSVKKMVVSDSQKGYSPSLTMGLHEISRRPHESVNRPSECIEMTMKNATENFKYKYTKAILFERERLCGPQMNITEKMAAIARMCELPVSTVGVKLRIEDKDKREIDAVVYNPSGVASFNIFNSSPLCFEAHNEQDVLVMMAAFLKHNGLWGEITANMDLFKFDYAGAFFDPRWTKDGDETSFATVRAQLLASYYKCKTAVRSAIGAVNSNNDNFASGSQKRKNVGDQETIQFPSIRKFEANTKELVDIVVAGSKAVVGGNGCPHSKDATHIYLEGGTIGYCVACFSSLFFVPKDVKHNFVNLKDLSGAQQWVDERLHLGRRALGPKQEKRLKHLMELLADLTQAAHGSDVKLGACGRRWNWPTTASPRLHEFILYSLFSALIEIREPILPEMTVDILYCLLSPFGKMLLLFLYNSLVMTTQRHRQTPSPGGTAVGRWWDVYYAGPNLWCLQITECERETGKRLEETASLETLGRLPWPGTETVDDRIIFKGFCRGENLAGPGEVISDITQSVLTIGSVLENREFVINKEDNRIISEPQVGPTLCSLEVTGYRPNRSQGSRNSGRVSARVMRILEAREGARVWYSPGHKALLFERVNHKADISNKAMERAINRHKILYYDIETNTVNFMDQGAVITSICCCLCTGGDISRGGERSVFGLASPGTDTELLRKKVLDSYPGYGNAGGHGGEYVVTDHAPDIVNIYSSELELLLGFSEYVQSRRPHVVSGWNTNAFDDPFVFTRIVKHLSRPVEDSCRMASSATVRSVLPDGGKRHATPKERTALARRGLFDLGQFLDPTTGYLIPAVSSDLLTGAASQSSVKFYDPKKESASKVGSAGWFQDMIGGCCTAIRLDLMKVCAKAYRECLSEYNLNAVLAKVSKVADRLKNVKDVVDLHYHLLGFLELKSVADQATVHVYCCKDAYLAAIVSTSINKEGEVFRLCLDSALIEPVVTANLVTPLCIGEGAICRNMGAKRASRRGVGIRRHSIATDTKGGMVSQPLVNYAPYQTIDMTSLYPMTMVQNNLCTSTSVTHRQVIELRDRMVKWYLEKKEDPSQSLLDILDFCNCRILETYRPMDISVPSWRNSNTNRGSPLTRLERKLGLRLTDGVGTGREDEDSLHRDGWSVNAPPNMAVIAAGMDYFPEIGCDTNIQQAAKANDDMHNAPSSIEYMLQVLPLLVIDRPHIVAHITAGRYQTYEECLAALESEFNEEMDARIIESHWTFAGAPQTDFSSGPVSERIRKIVATEGNNDKQDRNSKCSRLSTLLDRIYRRVSVYDSADDPGVRLWTSRLINVGMLARVWNIKNTAHQGVIPAMQMKYRADRVVMQESAMKYAAEGDIKRAGLNKVGQLTMKLAMNSTYGCLALRPKSHSGYSTASVTISSLANSSAANGIGGGTRHSVTANQITETARCVFGNIGCALQQSLPNIKQVYGDTDSIFCVHNIPGDGDMTVREGGKAVYLIDIVLKCKMSRLIPVLVNCTTKGIKPEPRRDAGDGMMNIAHERLALLGLLFAKKTYHMLHFNENSPAFASMVKACEAACIDREPVPMSHIDKFATLTPRPEYADGYVVPHNPGLILRAANGKGGEKLKRFLDKEGVRDENSLAEWLTSSKVWIELDATVVNNLYASKIVDAERGEWLDATTSRTLVSNEAKSAVSQAAAAFTTYKKGAFVKKGISASSKLKGLQSLLYRALPTRLNPSQRYLDNIKHHISNFASHTTNPSMMITSARVMKLDSSVSQTRPNPLALSINNHLNPSSSIRLGEKFNTVTAVSAWYLTADPKDVPLGYFNNSRGVRWNWESMRGCIPSFSIKNFSVVPNAIMTAYDMVENDKKALSAMIKKTADVLSTASAKTGFSLRPGALSYSTGVVVANDLATACIRIADQQFGQDPFVGNGRYVNCYDDDNDNSIQENQSDSCGCSDIGKNISVPKKEDIRDDILARIVHSAQSACDTVAARNRVATQAKSEGLNRYINQVMCLDKRVADQLDALVSQFHTVKSVSNKKRQPDGAYKSALDDMVAQAKVKFTHVLSEVAHSIKLHWQSCPVTAPDDGTGREEGAIFKIALDALSGQHKCTNTCTLSCCQSLYFVLLTTLALNFENERRRMLIPLSKATDMMSEQLFGGCQEEANEALRQISIARRLNIVRVSFPRYYNIDTDCLIYLFEADRAKLLVDSSSVASMTAAEIREAILRLSESKTTGKIWNSGDARFFGHLIDRDKRDAEVASRQTEEILPFVTGVYHRVSVEIAAACLAARLQRMP
uniref:DNA-directed DNA polymerase n=1 Tax=Trachysalambria curvirostris nimavirus TaxID=2984282 RepID=A0A9C7BNL1_9VIRU|nr:MAG: wsv514-like protein [Trachysalambria curvirostris nimavirus]